MSTRRPNHIVDKVAKWPRNIPPLAGPQSGEGWGDRAHAVLGPIGRAIHWPCMKGDGTVDLKLASLCHYIRQFMNKI